MGRRLAHPLIRDPGFNHAISGFADILDFDGGFALGCAPGTDVVTFNLAPDEVVVDATVTMIDFCGTGCTTVEFIGTLDSLFVENDVVGSPIIATTAGAGLGEILSIELNSFEGFFSEITITVDMDGGVACPTDFDDDDDTGFGDLLTILASWGCTTCPNEDLDGSGVVDFGDLLGVLAVWGPCSADGACCYPNGMCEMLSAADCEASDGNFEGPGADCESANCGF